MSKRILSMLLALVMALSLAVPAFAADEFEAEAPVIQEEAPAAPVAEEPEAPAEAPDMPAVAAVEPDVPAVAAEEPDDATDDAPGAGDTATYDGKLVIEGDETQIVRIIQFDSADWTYLGDPREVGVAPGAQINFVLEPGYAIEESEDGGYDWDWDDDDVYPATDDDILPVRVCVMYVPEEGGDMSVTIVEETALPETVPVTYSDDDARFGNASVAFKGEERYNYVFIKPGYTVTVDGGTLYGIFPSIDGTCLMAEYTVDEGADSVTVDFVKSTGKLIIDAPEGVIYGVDLFDTTDEETWWDTATWMGDLTLIPDIFPGMGFNLEMSPDYVLEGLDEALLLNTGLYLQEDPEGDHYGEQVRWYHLKTPDTGNIELTVKEAKTATVNYAGDTDGIVEKEETIYPGQEFSFTLQRGYYATFENCGINWDEVIQDKELFVYHCGTGPEGEDVTVTVHKTDAVLRLTEGHEFVWGNGMDDENGQYTSPIGGMKPGAHVWVALDGNAVLEFPDGEPEGLNDHYETITDPWDDHSGEIRHWYDFIAPDHDLEIHAVEGGEIPDAITVQFEGELDAIHYDTDQVYPGSSIGLRVQPGYYLETTFSNPDFTGEVDERGSNVFNLNVWPEAEEVTVTVGKASGALEIEDPEHYVWWASTIGDETTSYSDPTLGMKPGTRIDVALAANATLEFPDGEEPADLEESYEYWNYDPQAEFYGQLIHHIGFTAPEEGDVTAKAVEGGEMPEPITVQFEGEVDAVHYETDQVYPNSDLTLYVQEGYYLQTTSSDPNFDPELRDEDGCNGFHLYVWPDAENVTVTVGKAAGKLVVDDPEGRLWWTNASDDENCRFSDPTLGMKPGTWINIAVDADAALEFLGEEPEGLGDHYELWLDDPNNLEHYGKTVHFNDFIAPEEGDVNVKVVEGEAPSAITVQFEGEVDAIHYDTDQVYPGGYMALHVQPGYYLQVTDSDTWFGGQIDDKGNYVFDLNVWPDAENVTVTVGKATGKLVIDGAPVLSTWMESSDGSARMSDPALGLAPNATVGVTVPSGYAVQFRGAAEVGSPYQWIDENPDSPFFGQPVVDYMCLTPEEGDVTATILPVVAGAQLTIQGETDAVIPNDAQDVKDAISMNGDDDELLLSDGDVMEAGSGHILVKDGYTVTAVSGAEVVLDGFWCADDFTALYYDFIVVATDEAPVVKVEEAVGDFWFITATVANEDEADFQFTNADWMQMEDGTYKLVTAGYVEMIVEDGYTLDVDGATYWGTVTDEGTGDIVRVYELDEGAESITVTVTAVDKTELELTIAIVEAMAEFKDDYTAESWAAVEEALETAKVVAAKASATQAEVDAALDALDAAMDALVEVEPEIPAAPASGTGWVENKTTGDIYFYQKGEVKKSFWVGKADGASKWDGNWYYVGEDGKLVTGMAYLDDLHGGMGWYFLQPTNTNGEIGKMLTGWQWVGGEYGTCYFSAKSGESGKCTYSTELGNWNGTTWAK